MRVVADTNVVVSGLLWRGPSRQILDLARAETIQLFTSAALVAELRDVLERPKFASRLDRANVSVENLVVGYGSLAQIVASAAIEPVILADPDDDAVIACSIAARAQYIVSGDRHLLDLEQFQDCPIMKPAVFLEEIENES